MQTSALSPSEHRILRVLDSAPNKTEEAHGVRRLVKLTPRGFQTVVGRMEAKRLLSRDYQGRPTLALTFGGMTALAEAEQVSA